MTHYRQDRLKINNNKIGPNKTQSLIETSTANNMLYMFTKNKGKRNKNKKRNRIVVTLPKSLT